MATKLQKATNIKDKKIDEVENRIDDLEQYSRKDNIIISALTTNHKTWARRARPIELCNAGEHAPEQELEALECEVLSFLNF